jgi:hypothetical protein
MRRLLKRGKSSESRSTYSKMVLGLTYAKEKREYVYERINCQPPGVLYIPFRD